MIVTSTAYAAIDTQHRIKEPNSRPRQIKVIFLGAACAAQAGQFDASRFRNVDVIGVAQHWDGKGDAEEFLSTVNAGHGANVASWLQDADLLFVLAGEGDDVSLAPAIKQMARRLNISITGILMQGMGGGDAKTLEILRGASDMLIVTRNDDYLVDMLQELGA